MKKVLIMSLMLLILCAYFAIAQETSVSDKGYACLENKVANKCSSLSSEGKIFSLLAIDRCKTEVLADSDDNECWPKPKAECKLKTTAQAILALNSVGTATSEAEEWLLSQTTSPANIEWLLQIESEPASCTISYLDRTYHISIDEDKKITGTYGSCLAIYDDYWLKIRPQCYNEEFEISCNKTFFTNLLYMRKDSDVIYVLKGTNSASAEGTTTEKVNSLCFKQGTSCNYEGTLWAALVLNIRGYDTSAYLPYLITLTDEYSEFLPEAFLYSLTGSFGDELLLKQKESKWWAESADKFYDTAVALYSLQEEEPSEKTNAKAWLEEVQGDDGCWQNNLRNTAFILFSAWPKKTIMPAESKPDCEDSGYHCMTNTACQQAGEILTDYSGCFGTNVCCSAESLLKSCLLQDGRQICTSSEICKGGSFENATDTERCCVGGKCTETEGGAVEKTECEVYGGKCKPSCSENEESSLYDCPGFDECCFRKAEKTYTGIIILAILIVLVVLGIVFRKSLRRFFFRIKSRFKGKSAPSAPVSPRGFPPGPSASIPPRTAPRRILPPSHRQVRGPVAAGKPRQELDDVLKKLKEMGK